MSRNKENETAGRDSTEITDESAVNSAGQNGSAEETAAAQPSVESLTAELEQLRAEKDDQFDQLIRLKAEFENYKKRVQREIQERAKYAEEEFVRRLLSALDSFDRALAQPVGEGDVASVLEGFEQIRQQFHAAFTASGVGTVDSIGSKFDPYYHEALFTVESDEHEDNTVVDELERGYTLRGKVIRPAKVTVNVSRKTENGQSTEETSSDETSTAEKQQEVDQEDK